MAAGAASCPVWRGAAEGDSGNAVASRAWKGERPDLLPLCGTGTGAGCFLPASFLPPTHIAGTGSTMPLHDKFGRQITDVRISVTDRCNFRCVYCRSADPENYRPENELLTWPELVRVARVLRSLGLQKVRVTGGEPMIRPGVIEFISSLHALGFPDVSMTTNGQLLVEKCDDLIRAGLN